MGLGLHVWKALSQISVSNLWSILPSSAVPQIGEEEGVSGLSPCGQTCSLPLYVHWGPPAMCMDRQLAPCGHLGEEERKSKGDSDPGGGDMGHRPSDSCLGQPSV